MICEWPILAGFSEDFHQKEITAPATNCTPPVSIDRFQLLVPSSETKQTILPHSRSPFLSSPPLVRLAVRSSVPFFLVLSFRLSVDAMQGSFGE